MMLLLTHERSDGSTFLDDLEYNLPIVTGLKFSQVTDRIKRENGKSPYLYLKYVYKRSEFLTVEITLKEEAELDERSDLEGENFEDSFFRTFETGFVLTVHSAERLNTKLPEWFPLKTTNVRVEPSNIVTGGWQAIWRLSSKEVKKVLEAEEVTLQVVWLLCGIPGYIFPEDMIEEVNSTELRDFAERDLVLARPPKKQLAAVS